MIHRSNVTSFFAYLFFCLFVLVLLSLLVSCFSSTFSQLFVLLNQEGRIFDLCLRFLYFLGFLICLYALIISSWYRNGGYLMHFLMLILCIMFVFLFVFGVFGSQNQDSLLDSVLAGPQSHYLIEVFWRDLNEVLILGFFYVFFIFFPLACYWLNLCPNPNHPLGLILSRLRPSLNVIIYTLMGCALQSYFHKEHWFFYLDLIALGCALAMLLYLLKHQRLERLGFFEICNLGFLGVGICVFALSSQLIHEAGFLARYDFLMLAWVAWCAEWMLGVMKK